MLRGSWTFPVLLSPRVSCFQLLSLFPVASLCSFSFFLPGTSQGLLRGALPVMHTHHKGLWKRDGLSGVAPQHLGDHRASSQSWPSFVPSSLPSCENRFRSVTDQRCQFLVTYNVLKRESSIKFKYCLTGEFMRLSVHTTYGKWY